VFLSYEISTSHRRYSLLTARNDCSKCSQTRMMNSHCHRKASTRLCASFCWLRFAYVTNSYAGVVLGVYFFTFRVSPYFPCATFFFLCRECALLYLHLSVSEVQRKEHNGKSSRTLRPSSTHMTPIHTHSRHSQAFSVFLLLFGVRHTLARWCELTAPDYQSNSQSGCEKITYLCFIIEAK
jgi:hypothetical protein